MGYSFKKIITVNYTADDWELFCHEPGANDAAIELNRAVEEAINTSDNDREAYKKALVAFRKHEDLGALDSEPLYNLDLLINKAFSRV
jgi:hypothetical protein